MIQFSFTPLVTISVILAILSFVFWLGTWIGAVNTDRSLFKDFIKEIRSDIKKILGRLPQVTVSGASPIRLTDIGEAISEKLKIKDWAKEIALLVADQIEGKQPFEIQEFCFSYIENNFKPTDSQDNQLREVACSYSIDREQILQIFVVELRNQLLENAALEL